MFCGWHLAPLRFGFPIPKRYVDEFVGRHYIRHLNIETQIERIAKGFIGKVLTYKMPAGHRGNIARK